MAIGGLFIQGLKVQTSAGVEIRTSWWMAGLAGWTGGVDGGLFGPHRGILVALQVPRWFYRSVLSLVVLPVCRSGFFCLKV